jgi:hypothetical protein
LVDHGLRSNGTTTFSTRTIQNHTIVAARIVNHGLVGGTLDAGRLRDALVVLHNFVGFTANGFADSLARRRAAFTAKGLCGRGAANRAI